jgi:uncharacterized protein YjaZ
MSNLYQSYLFKTKDPAIDELRTLVQQTSGETKISRKHLKAIEEGGGPKTDTVARWFFGDVKRPQSATLEAAGRAIGYRRVWQRMNGKTK